MHHVDPEGKFKWYWVLYNTYLINMERRVV